MHYLSFVFALIFIAAVAQATNPGQCDAKTKCPNKYACISVESTYAGLEKLSQCSPQQLCSGREVGNCPSFSSWPKKYRKIQSVCAFTEVPNCVAKSGSGSNNVDCFKLYVEDGGKNHTVMGIYKCVDALLYEKKNLGYYRNLTEMQLKACAGNVSAGSLHLCNGQGTCAPVSPFSSTYECKCNAGFDKKNNCYKATSNDCNNLGQCGAAGKCNVDSKQCECKAGATGNQCSQCKKGDTKACNGEGTCDSNGKCKCNSGYGGEFCEPSSGNSAGSTLNTVYAVLLSVTFAFGGIIAMHC